MHNPFLSLKLIWAQGHKTLKRKYNEELEKREKRRRIQYEKDCEETVADEESEEGEEEYIDEEIEALFQRLQKFPDTKTGDLKNLELQLKLEKQNLYEVLDIVMRMKREVKEREEGVQKREQALTEREKATQDGKPLQGPQKTPTSPTNSRERAKETKENKEKKAKKAQKTIRLPTSVRPRKVLQEPTVTKPVGMATHTIRPPIGRKLVGKKGQEKEEELVIRPQALCQVLWSNDKYYPARIVKADGDKITVAWLGLEGADLSTVDVSTLTAPLREEKRSKKPVSRLTIPRKTSAKSYK